MRRIQRLGLSTAAALAVWAVAVHLTAAPRFERLGVPPLARAAVLWVSVCDTIKSRGTREWRPFP